MSFEAAAWAINQQTRSQTAKLVLIALSNCHNRDTGQCNPGNAYLMTVAQCAARAINYALAELEDLGLISADRARGKRTEYRLFIGKTSADSALLRRTNRARDALPEARESSADNALLIAEEAKTTVQTNTESSAPSALAHLMRQRTECGGVAHLVRGSSALCDIPFSIESVKNQERTRNTPPTTRARATDFATPSEPDQKPAANTPAPADPAWVRAELERPAAQPAAACPPAFAMHADWEPDHVAMGERCQGSGIPPGIDPGLLIEFRSYWAGEGIALRQSQWEHKLFRQLIHAHRATRANPDPIPGAPHATSRRPRAATAADIDFADTSWLDERTIERCRSALDQHGV